MLVKESAVLNNMEGQCYSLLKQKLAVIADAGGGDADERRYEAEAAHMTWANQALRYMIFVKNVHI